MAKTKPKTKSAGKNKGEIGETYVAICEVLDDESCNTAEFGNGIKIEKENGKLICNGKEISFDRLDSIRNKLKEEMNLKTKNGVVDTVAMNELKELLGRTVSAPSGKEDLAINGQVRSIKTLKGSAPDHLCYKKYNYIKFKIHCTAAQYEKYQKDLKSTNKKTLELAHNPLKYFNELGDKIDYIGPCTEKTRKELEQIDKKLPAILGKIVLISRTTSKSTLSDILTKEEIKIFNKFNSCLEKGYNISDKYEFDIEKFKHLKAIPMIFLNQNLEIKMCNSLSEMTDICDVIYSDKFAFSKRATGEIEGLVAYEENGEYFVNDCPYTRYRINKIFPTKKNTK